MSRETLLAALRRDARQLLDQLQAQGAARLLALQRETASHLQQLQEDEDRRRRRQAAGERQAQLAQGRRLALAERLRGEERLQQRLWQLARPLLAELATREPEALLAALADELPTAEWQQVAVNPGATALAGRRFPRARISGDAGISGGLRCTSADGRIVVDNTLETRLARGWPELLPLLFATLEADDAAAPD